MKEIREVQEEKFFRILMRFMKEFFNGNRSVKIIKTGFGRTGCSGRYFWAYFESKSELIPLTPTTYGRRYFYSETDRNKFISDKLKKMSQYKIIEEYDFFDGKKNGIGKHLWGVTYECA